MKQQKTILNYFVFSLMFLLVAPSLIQKGLFMDGEIYSAIAHNLHIGKGSFWFPHWTGDIYSPFHQHPPLAFGLQSLYHDIFGSSLYTDRLFSFSMAIFAFILIGKIWRLFYKERDELNFLPRLLWITVPVVFWCYTNNMLENTVTVTCLLAVYALLKAGRAELTKSLLWYFLAAVCLLAGFLTKGPVALFPLGVPFIYSLVEKQYLDGIKKTTILTAMLGLVCVLLVLLIPQAKESIETYIDKQVQPSLKGEAVVVRRTYILERLFMEILPMIGLLLIYFFTRIKKWSAIPKANQRHALFFLLLGLSASLPIMISPKQLMFYIAPSMPYFALSVSCLLVAHVSTDLKSLVEKRLWKPVMLSLASAVLVLGIVLTVNNDGKYRRDKEFVHDAELIGEHIPEGSSVSMTTKTGAMWMILAYFPRYYQLELYRSKKDHPFIVQMKGEAIVEGYELVDLPTEKLQLIHRAN